MKSIFSNIIILLIVLIFAGLMSGCGRNRDGNRPLAAEVIDGPPIINPENPVKPNGMFSYKLGESVPVNDASVLRTEETGLTVCDDYDGDGIRNTDEITTNAFVAEYPRIVTRISAPITMEIRVSETSTSENHTETIEDSGVTSTISNSMEDRQYTSVNDKTMPYTSKESNSESMKNAGSWGVSDSSSTSTSFSLGGGYGGANASSSGSKTVSNSHSENGSWDDEWSRSASSEKLAFSEARLSDNLEKSGTAFTSDCVEKITKNSRMSNVLKKTTGIGPENGVVRASLYIKNETVNMPSHISDVKCTLTFRTPSGKFLPIKTFVLRNEDYSMFEQDVYGSEELGPYTIELTGLNTVEVTNALKNGYIPQIHVISYDLIKVKESNYNPGVENLKVVEENAKGRTAYITISAKGYRESFRVCAFDIDSNGRFSPGISLKKALFNIFRSRVGSGELWDRDVNRKPLTVGDSGLKWKAGAADPYNYTYSSNCQGNSWKDFETYVKRYTDELNNVHYIETIKRIDTTVKYNPFDKKDNPSYDPNDLLTEHEIRKMKYWYVMHDGRYFQGDINDPIWVGERYEIVCVDVDDLNNHFRDFVYTPLQSADQLQFDTRWNILSDSEPFSRARYFGKLFRDDTVTLEVDLKETRYLSDPAVSDKGDLRKIWNVGSIPYRTISTAEEKIPPNGIPSEFHFSAQGGVNNIEVRISNADNAENYDVFLNCPDGKEKRYRITVEELSMRGNVFWINRKTADSSGAVTGFLPAGNYRVKVKSNGRLYGVDVSREAIEKTTVVEVLNSVMEIPGDFNYISAGYTGSLSVNISAGKNTEYYAVVYTGPLNGISTTTTVTASAGYNVFPVGIPSGFDDRIRNSVPGVYEVRVYPVNEYFVTTYSGIKAYSDRAQYVTVGFEKYTAQKSLRAQKWNVLSMKEAVNLEVNFNDGSGWYKLKTIASDNANKSIDCVYSNYFDYKNQKFYISFKPPVGGMNLFNVFAGGRDSVDLFIRTEPREAYRDRFWPRADSSIGVTFPSDALFFDKWVYCGMSTDATMFENIVANPSSVSDSYSLSGSDCLNDKMYFFSPYEYRVLSVNARLSGEMLSSSEASRIAAPSFEADTSGHDTINVKNITSADSTCSEFLVYYKPVYTVTPNDSTDITVLNCADEADNLKIQSIINENVSVWKSAGIVRNVKNSGSTASAEDRQIKITGISPNVSYALAVIAKNSNDFFSSPAFLISNSGKNLNLVVPRSRMTPVPPSTYALAVGGDDGKTVFIDNIYSGGSTSYILQYCESWNDNWKSLPDLVSSFDKPCSSVIAGTNLSYWETYRVRIKASNRYAAVADSAYGPVKLIQTSYRDVTTNVENVRWTNIVNDGAASHSDMDVSQHITCDISFTAKDIPVEIRSIVYKLEIVSDLDIKTFEFSVDNIESGKNCTAVIGYPIYTYIKRTETSGSENFTDITETSRMNPRYSLYVTSYTNKSGSQSSGRFLVSEGKLNNIDYSGRETAW
jgi:hypothetical protein